MKRIVLVLGVAAVTGLFYWSLGLGFWDSNGLVAAILGPMLLTTLIALIAMSPIPVIYRIVLVLGVSTVIGLLYWMPRIGFWGSIGLIAVVLVISLLLSTIVLLALSFVPVVYSVVLVLGKGGDSRVRASFSWLFVSVISTVNGTSEDVEIVLWPGVKVWSKGGSSGHEPSEAVREGNHMEYEGGQKAGHKQVSTPPRRRPKKKPRRRNKRRIEEWWQGLRAGLDKALSYRDAFLEYPGKEAIANAAKRMLADLSRAVMPERLELVAHCGLGDAAHTGYGMAAMSVVQPFFGDRLHIDLIPDFERVRFDGELSVRGRLQMFALVRPVLRFALRADVVRLIVTILRGRSRRR